MTLSEKFPNATPTDRWTPPSAVQEAERHANVRECNLPNADYLMAHHAVSTYDAREEALQVAVTALMYVEALHRNNKGPVGPKCASARRQIEAALEAKP